MNGKPISFLVVLSVTIVLTIFFGAWAVSADLEGQGLPALARTLNAADISEGGSLEVRNPAAVGPGSISVEATDSAWWQNTLLNLCPIH